MKFIRKLLKGRSGQTAMEYALVIAVVATVIVFAAKSLLGDKDKGVENQVFAPAVNAVNQAIGNNK